MITIAVGLGSNMGDRLLELRLASEALALLGSVQAISSIYETEPIGDPRQPSYLNAVLLLTTSASPQELLASCQRHEAKRGRERSIRWGPRLIDCDLLLADGLVLESESLILPHARLADRRFVLVPLCEVAPDMRHPILGKTVRELIERCRDEGRVERTPFDLGRGG